MFASHINLDVEGHRGHDSHSFDLSADGGDCFHDRTEAVRGVQFSLEGHWVGVRDESFLDLADIGERDEREGGASDGHQEKCSSRTYGHPDRGDGPQTCRAREALDLDTHAQDGARAEEADSCDDLCGDAAGVAISKDLADLREEDDADDEEHMGADACRPAADFPLKADRSAEDRADAEFDDDDPERAEGLGLERL